MTIEYGNSQFTRAQRNLMHARATGALWTRGRYYWQITFPINVAGLGAFSSFCCADRSSLFLLVGFLLAGHTAELLYRWRPYDRWLRNLYFHGSLDSDLKRIRLEVTDDGLTEHQGDIVSFAGWKDVVDTLLEGDLLVIRLSSGQEALIPRTCFDLPELNLEEIRSDIDRRRIPNGLA